MTSWTGIVAVAAGNVHTARNTGRSHNLGLRADGTVVAAGRHAERQCDVGGWSGIRAVAAGYLHTVGLGDDDEVVATGEISTGACDVLDWSDVSSIAAGSHHTRSAHRRHDRGHGQ